MSIKKTIILAIDNKMGSNLGEKARNFRTYWYNSNLLNIIRRNIDFAIVKFKYKLGIKHKTPLKLHLGCGNRHLEGYINIDLRKTISTDLVCNIRKLPYPNNTVELIETYHVIEHLSRHDLSKALKEWFGVISPGGMLIVECPDFDKAVKEYIGGNEKRINNIFGLQRFLGDTHMFGYNFKRLKKLLEEAGFRDIQEKEPQDYHTKDEPCLRIECFKG
jgi:predicted SAM-dependent methyltransferase